LCALFGLAGAAAMRIYGPPEAAERVALAAFVAAYVAGGIGPTLSAASALLRGQLNVDLLMILAAVGAAAIGDWVEGAVLLFLFSLSGSLEAFANYRTTRSIESLMKLRPREALLVRGEGRPDELVAVETLAVGDTVRIRPGERHSVDGVVCEGESWADESTLTGESEPIAKTVGSQVFAGTINGSGSLLVRMTRAVADTTLARIVDMVQEAQAQKTPAQRFVESWQRPYVIGVLAASALTYVGARWLHSRSEADAFYHAMVLLVAASPCAVVVSSPAVMLSAIARAGRAGVLFKGSAAMESLGQVDVIAFDKTGTLTVGKPAVMEVWSPPGVDENRWLTLAATLENRSEHPLAAPVVAEAARRGLALSEAPLADFHSHAGLGVHARIDGTWVGVGREQLFATHDVALPAAIAAQGEQMRAAGRTALLAALSDGAGGVIAMADPLRSEAAGTLAALKRLGVSTTVMLTGDHPRVADAIAAQVGVDEVRAGLMPDQKAHELRRLATGGRQVAMIGDGVNDAPALAAAAVGVAMGGAGSDVALVAADVVLMADDLRTLPTAVWISRLARRRVRQNFVFAFSMIALLVLSTFFDLPLWMGVLGHEGSTVAVVFNGLRMLWQKTPKVA
jgi:Cd2+/Zn2+-exporting ATPase